MRIRYFDIGDFGCPCCNRNRIDSTFVLLLDEARHRAGVPFGINSGFRCTNHNTEVRGSSSSSHLIGVAADIACTNSTTRLRMVNALLSVGINRIGIGSTFIHCDIDPNKPNCIYLY